MDFYLQITLGILIISIAGSFLGGLFTGNYSHVDRLWSILPPLYVLVWMFKFHDNPRFVVTAALIILWGVRLTANFARRGGYKFSWNTGFTGEDYRWDILRKKISNRFLFELFNLGFISGFQLGLIFLFTLPAYIIGTVETQLNTIDITLFLLFIFFLIGETIADNQQFSFHGQKKDKAADNPCYALGFNTTGLWKYTRHPNYLCEMGQWVTVWFIAANATGTWHKSGIGALILIILFIGSTIMTEGITESKYPRFSSWRKATPPWIPFIDLPFRLKARQTFWRELEKK
jgi:steroid 5-alpha reductase family enzyme